jgi:hypothetical protein
MRRSPPATAFAGQALPLIIKFEVNITRRGRVDQLADRDLAALDVFARERVVEATREPVVDADQGLKRLAQVMAGHRQESDVKFVGALEIVHADSLKFT